MAKKKNQPAAEEPEIITEQEQANPDEAIVAEAEEEVQGLVELLAEHERQVAEFYRRNKYYVGAMWRLEYIVENYPNYSQIELVNTQLNELKTLIEERDAAWKKQLEQLRKDTED